LQRALVKLALRWRQERLQRAVLVLRFLDDLTEARPSPGGVTSSQRSSSARSPASTRPPAPLACPPPTRSAQHERVGLVHLCGHPAMPVRSMDQPGQRHTVLGGEPGMLMLEPARIETTRHRRIQTSVLEQGEVTPYRGVDHNAPRCSRVQPVSLAPLPGHLT
jgi:hypothetical protein